MSTSARDAQGNTVHEYPRYLDEGEKILLGIVNGAAEYYDRVQHRVDRVIAQDEGEFLEQGHHQLGAEDDVVDHIHLSQEAHDGYDALTDYAEAMLRAEELSQTGAITRDQAEVFVLRAEYELFREDVANMLGKSASTVDSLLVTAKDKIERARQLSQQTVPDNPNVINPVQDLHKKHRGEASECIADDVDREIIDVTIIAREQPGSTRISTAIPEDANSREIALSLSENIAELIEDNHDTVGTGVARDGFFRRGANTPRYEPVKQHEAVECPECGEENQMPGSLFLSNEELFCPDCEEVIGYAREKGELAVIRVE